jgi:phosphoribosylformimino-5-aminoimidazole carboxamide ribotide isomerase
MSFDVYPAIDLRHGRVVRLELGDPARQTIFSDDPAATAGRWLDAGARWLHVVNLDGAFAEAGRANWKALDELGQLAAHIQFGGGLRTLADVAAALDCGVTRVVLGTAALETPEMVAAALARFGPQQVAVGIDARAGWVHTRGWQTATVVSPDELGRGMAAMGVQTIIYTDIARDGILTGVNVAATAALAGATGLEVIASGGVRSLEDVARLRARAASGIAGVIIGRALYEGRVNLAAALALAQQGDEDAG